MKCNTGLKWVKIIEKKETSEKVLFRNTITEVNQYQVLGRINGYRRNCCQKKCLFDVLLNLSLHKEKSGLADNAKYISDSAISPFVAISLTTPLSIT